MSVEQVALFIVVLWFGFGLSIIGYSLCNRKKVWPPEDPIEELLRKYRSSREDLSLVLRHYPHESQLLSETMHKHESCYGETLLALYPELTVADLLYDEYLLALREIKEGKRTALPLPKKLPQTH